MLKINSLFGKIKLHIAEIYVTALHPSLYPFGKRSIEFKLLVSNVEDVFEAN